MIGAPGIMAVLAGLLFSFGFLLIASGIRNSVAALRYAGAILVSVPLGGITYAIVGAKLGQHMGQRFYSVPFAATELHSRAAVWGSAVCWVVVWCLALSLVLSRVGNKKRSSNGIANGR